MPHRKRFQTLAWVSLDPSRGTAIASFMVPEEFCDGHIEGYALVPGSYMIDPVSQVLGALCVFDWLNQTRHGPPAPGCLPDRPLLVSLHGCERTRWKLPVRPGQEQWAYVQRLPPAENHVDTFRAATVFTAIVEGEERPAGYGIILGRAENRSNGARERVHPRAIYPEYA